MYLNDVYPNMTSFVSIIGVGGTTDTANTGRRFYGEKREQFLDLVEVSIAHLLVLPNIPLL